MGLFKLEILPNGRKHILFCGLKIVSYKYGNRIIDGDGNRIFNIPKGLKIHIKGSNNTIKLKYPITIKNSKIYIDGNNNFIEIGKDTKLLNLEIYCRFGSYQKCVIGNKTTCYGMTIRIGETGQVIIGEDCMFSNSISIWCGDGHSVIDINTNQILNRANSVIIGNHVWIGEGVKITKRTKLYDNSIVGINSVVCKDYKYGNIVLGGNPAQIIKENITWDRIDPYNLSKMRCKNA